MPFNPSSILTSKIFAGVSFGMLIVCGILWLNLKHVSNERDKLQAWKVDVVAATRDAAHRPNLAEKNVAQQVRFLGDDLDRVIAAQEKATQKAVAAKQDRERRDNDNKRRSDDALPSQVADQRRRSSPWIGAHRVRDSGKAAPPTAGGNSSRANLPTPAFATGEPDGPDRGPELVAVPAAYIDACDVVTARLYNAQDWATETLTSAPAGDTQTHEVTP